MASRHGQGRSQGERRSQVDVGPNRTLIYRTQLENLKELRDNSETLLPDDCISKVRHVIEEMEGIETTETPLTSAEMCLDLHVTNITGKVIKEQCMATANTRAVFDEREFIEKLTNKFVKDNEFDFHAIGLIGRQILLKSVPGYFALMGHLPVEARELTQKERRPREARKKDAVVEAKAPEKLTKAPEKTEGGIDEICVKVRKALKRAWKNNGKQPVSYFNFVLHPTDFAKTVQNMFHISFLVKDGNVAMDMCSEGYPVIIPTNCGDKDEKRKTEEVSKLPKKQMITSLSVRDWRELVETFDVTEAAFEI